MHHRSDYLYFYLESSVLDYLLSSDSCYFHPCPMVVPSHFNLSFGVILSFWMTVEAQFARLAHFYRLGRRKRALCY